MSRLGENDGLTVLANATKSLGIGRGFRASQPVPPAPVPTPAKTSIPHKARVNAASLQENREFLRDIARRFQTDKKPVYREDIIAEFARFTGFPLSDVASALGFGTETEMFDSMELDYPLRSQGAFPGRGVAGHVSTAQVNRAAKPSVTRNRKNAKSSRQ